ncbi:MAG TPA: hypothetical protein VH501_06895 [Solirubrobacterales bacterium]
MPVFRTVAVSGVAFDATAATFSPALPTGPFDELERDFVRVELLRLRVLPARELPLLGLLDEPFRLVDLVDLEPVRRERVLEDRVVWAMVLVTPRLPCQLRLSRWR